MSRFKRTEREGQALVEFALIIGVLFLIIFIVIESGHLLHANLTVQSAAREAGRYAITGQFDTDCLTESPPCADPRVHSVKALAREKLAGLSLDDNAVFEEAGYFLIEVFGTNAAGEWVADSTGMPGRPILVRISYRANIWTPLLRPIAETVMVTGQTIMNNEKVVQIGSAGDTEAPPVPPPPPIQPTPQPVADVQITKSGPSVAMENRSFVYNLSVTNSGLGDASEVVLTDDLDTNLIYESHSGAGCTGGQTVSCSWETLASGETQNIEIVVRADAGTAGRTVYNDARVEFTGPGSESSPITSLTVETLIEEETNDIDVAIIKTGPAAAPISSAGSPRYIDYQLTLTNHGPNDAENVQVIDILPSGLLFNSEGSSDECTGGQTITCTAARLPNGQEATFVIRVRTPEVAATLTNTASISVPNDTDAGNDTSSVPTQFSDMADLEITKTASASSIYAGETLYYYIDVENLETSQAATGVYITDPLPAGVQLIGAMYSSPQGAGNCAISGNVVTCFIGTLQPGETARATIAVIPLIQTTLYNTAQVTGDQTDPDGINSVSVPTEVEAAADLSIVKSAPERLYAGSLLVYTLTVTNNGPSRATNVTVVDEMPAAEYVVFQFADSDRGYCQWDPGTREVICRLGTMPVASTAVITITAIPISPGSQFTNHASVTATERDDVDPNNDSTPTTALLGLPFIVLQPACTLPTTPDGQQAQIQIDGYLWNPDVNGSGADPTLYWSQSSTSFPSQNHITTINRRSLADTGGRFTYMFDIPTGINNGTIYVRARQRQETGSDFHTDIKTIQIPCPGLDLEVTAMSTEDADVQQYQPVDFDVTVINSGDRDSETPFYVSLYAFEDPPEELTLSSLSVANRLDVAMIASLGRGESRELTLRAHEGFPDTGTHYVYAVVDSDPTPAGSVVEVNENNNIFEVVLEVTQNDTGVPPDWLPGTAELSGDTYIVLNYSGDWQLQPLVRVTVYDAPGGTRIASTYSTYPEARYQFTELPNLDNYYVEASITVNGQAYVFPGTGSGIVSSPIRSLILEQQQGP